MNAKSIYYDKSYTNLGHLTNDNSSDDGDIINECLKFIGRFHNLFLQFFFYISVRLLNINYSSSGSIVDRFPGYLVVAENAGQLYGRRYLAFPFIYFVV